MMGKPNDGELCSCDGFEFNARKLRMLPCGCYGCVKVKKCMKTQFSIYNRKMVYIIFQVCIYIYMHVSIPGSPAVHTHYINIYIYTAGLKVRIESGFGGSTWISSKKNAYPVRNPGRILNLSI